MISEAGVEVLTEPERLVEEMGRPGAFATQIARRYGISTGPLYTWRRQVRSGLLSLAAAASSPALMPVEVVAESPFENVMSG